MSEAPATTRRALVLDVGSAVDALAGESVSGDAALTRRLDDGSVLAVLADGLGHGLAAAKAATQCLEAISRAASSGLSEALLEAHRALRGGRGAVAAAAVIDPAKRTLRTCIVGNVALRRVRTAGGGAQSVSAAAIPGILGAAFRHAPVQTFDLEAGDVVVIHSDGVRSQLSFPTTSKADATARGILRHYSRGRDDASCIVVRVLQACET
jgi:serine phosphatase RsbU (regulator of sigma subunit)